MKAQMYAELMITARRTMMDDRYIEEKKMTTP